MRPLASREPGPIAQALESTDAWYGLIVDGVHASRVRANLLSTPHAAKAARIRVCTALAGIAGRYSWFPVRTN